MESCKLQIILHSGKALNNVKNFGTMDPYVLVWTDRNGKQSEPRRTKVAKKGASSPVWECPMEFKVVTSMQNNYTLMFEIKHDGKLLDRDIGQVEVPFTDLLAGDGFGDNVSYPVKMSSGEIKGEIVVSHKFMEQEVRSSVEKENGCPKKKVTPKKKKKNSMMKRVAKNVVVQVATKAVLLAGTVGLVVAFEGMDDGSAPSTVDENVDENENENEDYVDEDEDEDEDEDDDDVEDDDDDDDV